MTGRALRYGALIGAVYIVSCLALWFGYSMRAQIDGGSLRVVEAHGLVFRMAAITTFLCVAAVASGKLIFRPQRALRSILHTGLCTGSVLVAYTAVNVLWRNSWEPTSGRPPFLPLWGGVNDHFFYEYNWLSYLLFVTPLVTVAACTVSWLMTIRRP